MNCPRHDLPLVPPSNPSAEAVWCGDWLICSMPGCWHSTLNPSPALTAQLDQQKAAAR